MLSSLLFQYMGIKRHVLEEKLGAGNETRTRDPDLGKVVLYQLSYSRFNQNVLIFLTNLLA